MRRAFGLGLLLLVVAAGAVPVSESAQGNSAEDKKVLRHIVLYKFKDGLPIADVKEVIDTFAALPSKIDTIVGFEHGANVSPEGKSEGLTHAFVVSFRDEAGRDAYLEHPAHLDYVDVVKNRREKVVVFDYWAAE